MGMEHIQSYSRWLRNPVPVNSFFRENNTVKYGNYSRGMAPLLWIEEILHQLIYRFQPSVVQDFAGPSTVVVGN